VYVAVVENVPVGYDQLLASAYDCVPLRLPEPVHDATVPAIVLLIVPGVNPVPLAVQVTLVMAITSPPLVRSLAARTVNVTDAPVAVLALAVIEIAPPLAGIVGTTSGSALAKVTVEALSASFAAADTVTVAVTAPAEVAADSGCASAAATTVAVSQASRMFIVSYRGTGSAIHPEWSRR